MAKFRRKFKVGDMVYISCYTSMGASSEGDQKVTEIKVRYDHISGQAYDVICFGDHEFHGITGEPIKGPTMYYIDVCPLVQGKEENPITTAIKAAKERMKVNYGPYDRRTDPHIMVEDVLDWTKS